MSTFGMFSVRMLSQVSTFVFFKSNLGTLSRLREGMIDLKR